MNIFIFLLFVYKDVFSFKLSHKSSGFGFIPCGHNNFFKLQNSYPSINKLNKYSDCSLKDSINQPNYDSYQEKSVNPTLLGYKSFKLRGVKLDSNIVPLNDYVLILKTQVDDVTKSGVYIGSKDKDFVGRVIAVGPGRLNKETGVVTPLSVSVGNYVLYHRPEKIIDLKLDDTPCLLLKEDNIYARIDLPKHLIDSEVRYDKIVPLSDRILVKVLQSPKRTESGLVISNTETKDDLIRARVVSIGAGRYSNDGKLMPITNLNVGDEVLYSETVSDRAEFSAEGVNYTFIRREAVLGKL